MNTRVGGLSALIVFAAGLGCAKDGDQGRPDGGVDQSGGRSGGSAGSTSDESSSGSGGAAAAGGAQSAGAGGSGGITLGAGGQDGGAAGAPEPPPRVRLIEPGPGEQDQVLYVQVATAPGGSAYLAGEAWGPATYDAHEVTAQGAFLFRVDPEGDLGWVAPITTEQQAAITSVAVDSSGSVVVGGSFYGDVRFDSQRLSADTLLADLFVAKWDARGALVFAKRFGSASSDNLEAIATDLAGNIYVGGYVQEDIDFGAGLVSVDGGDAFLLALSPSGGTAWAKVFDNSGSSSTVSGLATDAAGNLLITGYTNGSLNIAGTVVDLAQGAYYGAFLAKFSSSGALHYARGFGGGSFALAHGLASGSAHFVAGLLTGGSDVLGRPVPDGEQAAFVAKFDDEGAAEWVVVPQRPATIFGVVASPDGGFHAVGTRSLPSGTLPFVTDGDASGTHVETHPYRASLGSAEGIALADDGALWVVGPFTGRILFDDGIPREVERTHAFVLRRPAR